MTQGFGLLPNTNEEPPEVEAPATRDLDMDLVKVLLDDYKEEIESLEDANTELWEENEYLRKVCWAAFQLRRIQRWNDHHPDNARPWRDAGLALDKLLLERKGPT